MVPIGQISKFETILKQFCSLLCYTFPITLKEIKWLQKQY